jgi:hypothetical protein
MTMGLRKWINRWIKRIAIAMGIELVAILAIGIWHNSARYEASYFCMHDPQPDDIQIRQVASEEVTYWARDFGLAADRFVLIKRIARLDAQMPWELWFQYKDDRIRPRRIRVTVDRCLRPHVTFDHLPYPPD